MHGLSKVGTNKHGLICCFKCHFNLRNDFYETTVTHALLSGAKCLASRKWQGEIWMLNGCVKCKGKWNIRIWTECIRAGGFDPSWMSQDWFGPIWSGLGLSGLYFIEYYIGPVACYDSWFFVKYFMSQDYRSIGLLDLNQIWTQNQLQARLVLKSLGLV